MENNAYCNQSIMCSVTNCKHHNSTKDYCSLGSNQGRHSRGKSDCLSVYRTARALKQSAAASNLIWPHPQPRTGVILKGKMNLWRFFIGNFQIISLFSFYIYRFYNPTGRISAGRVSRNFLKA